MSKMVEMGKDEKWMVRKQPFTGICLRVLWVPTQLLCSLGSPAPFSLLGFSTPSSVHGGRCLAISLPSSLAEAREVLTYCGKSHSNQHGVLHRFGVRYFLI